MVWKLESFAREKHLSSMKVLIEGHSLKLYTASPPPHPLGNSILFCWDTIDISCNCTMKIMYIVLTGGSSGLLCDLLSCADNWGSSEVPILLNDPHFD